MTRAWGDQSGLPGEQPAGAWGAAENRASGRRERRADGSQGQAPRADAPPLPSDPELKRDRGPGSRDVVLRSQRLSPHETSQSLSIWNAENDLQLSAGYGDTRFAR